MEKREIKITKDVAEEKDARIARLEKELKFVKRQMTSALSLYDEAKQETDAAVKTKGEFMSKLSHEFRTPMNALMGYSDLLIKRDMNEVTRRYATGIKSATNRLLNLFNDLIEVSRIESGITSCESEEYDTGVLISSVIDSFSNEVEEKGLIMKLDIAEDIPSRLYGDFHHLRQILCNLLDNAVKYTDKGYVSLEINCKKGEELSENGRKRTVLAFVIKDTGRGIRKKDKDKLFNVFAQFNSKNPYANQGIGVGLTVAKFYSNLMHGDITFESTYGEGSTFTCYVMQEIVNEEPISASYIYGNTRREIVFTAPSAKILVVDDSNVNLFVARGLLEDYGINVDLAEGGLQAVKQVGKKCYDLIFMDHMMPDVDGIETTRRIREKGNWCEDVPIIPLTANATDEAKQLFKMEGMQDFLAKPIELNLLRDILLKWLPMEKIVFSDVGEGYVVKSEVLDTSHKLSLMKAKLLDEGIDMEEGLKYFGGNIDAYKETMNTILKDCRRKVDLVEKYFLEGNLKSYAIEAHAIKSVSATIGANVFSQIAKEHELKAKAEDNKYIEENGSYFIRKYRELLNSIDKFLLEQQQIQETEREPEPDCQEVFTDEQINEIIVKVMEAVKDFEADEAIDLLRSLMQFHEKVDLLEKLHEVQELIEDFEYDEAIEALKKLIK